MCFPKSATQAPEENAQPAHVSIRHPRHMLENLKHTLHAPFHRSPKLAFLHVPKTGGTYLAQRESDHAPLLPVKYLGHIYVVDKRDVINPLYSLHSPHNYHQTLPLQKIKKYTVLSIARNIFSWLVSYAWHAGGWNPKYRDTGHYDYASANKGFEYLFNTIVNREDYWPNRKFIHVQFFCNNGDWIVDWLGRNETLDQDLAALAQENHFSFTPQTKQRVGHKTDYRTYYTDKMADLVYETWGRELDLFGYDFEGLKKETRYHRALDAETKSSLRYDLARDVLTVNGSVIPR